MIRCTGPQVAISTKHEKVNWYQLITTMRKAWEWYLLSAIEQALFYELLWLGAYPTWKETFTCSNTYLAGILQTSERSIRTAREQLTEKHLISFRSGKNKRMPSSYSLTVDLATGQPLAEWRKATRENRQETDETAETENAENAEAEAKEKEILAAARETFGVFREQYPGIKQSLDTEFLNFRKKHPHYLTLLPLLMPALDRWETWRNQQAAAGAFVPSYPHLKTWINQRRWEDEFTQFNTNNHEKEPPTIID